MDDELCTAATEASFRYPGWRVTLAAFVGVMVSFAALVPFTFSLFIAPLHEAFGWHREAISSTFGIAAMTVAVFSPGIGHLLDRFPPRRIILPSIVVFALAVMSLSVLTPHIAQFYFTYFILGVVGNGTAQLAYSRTVLTWFDQRRGLALAVMLTGSGTGSILLPIIAQASIHAYGWRSAYLILGGIALLGFPLTAALVRNRSVTLTEAEDCFATGSDVRTVLRSTTFWILAISILLYALSANGVISHLAALLTERGVTGSSAAMALAILGASGIAGRLLTGWLLDRFFAPYVSFVMLLVAGGGVLTLAFADTASSGIAGAILLGFGTGSEADVAPYLIARYFGRKHFSMIYGLTWAAYAVGGATGPVLMGRAYDRHAVYDPHFVLLMVLPCVAAAALCLLLPRYKTSDNSILDNASLLQATANVIE